MAVPKWLVSYVRLMKGGGMPAALLDMTAKKTTAEALRTPAAQAAYEEAAKAYHKAMAPVVGAYTATGLAAGAGTYGVAKAKDDPTIMDIIRRTRVGRLLR